MGVGEMRMGQHLLQTSLLCSQGIPDLVGAEDPAVMTFYAVRYFPTLLAHRRRC